MGTSGSFDGAGSGTPLLPTWADSPSLPALNLPPLDQQGESQPLDELQRPPLDVAPEGNRFQVARSNFSRFVTSGGTDRRALGRAVRDHIRTGSGGSGTAARRMGASRQAASRLTRVLQDIQSRGIAETLRSLALDHLIGRPPREVFIALTDFVCAPGGTIEEGIARDAYVETIIDLAETGEDFDSFTNDQINSVVLGFISRSIVNRIVNDIGQKIDVRSLSGDQANYLMSVLKDLVYGAVKDRLQERIQDARSIALNRLNQEMTLIYERAFAFIDDEAGRLI
jgi:hypothetical protein